MQAIIKDNHVQFCNLIQEIRISRSLEDHDLAELESELCTIFQNYQQRISDVRELILEYDAKKKIIRSKIRQLVREDATRRSYKL